MSRKTIHVVPSSTGGWDINNEGKEKKVSHHSTKADAIKEAQTLARDSNTGMFIHRKDGKISEVRIYKESSGRVIRSSPATAKSKLDRKSVRESVATTSIKRDERKKR